MLESLKTYYCNLFFSTRVQTFILNHNNKYFYDPYMIEFIRKHKLVSIDDKYIHVAHQTYLPATFSLDYDRTFFRFVEHPDLNSKKKPRIYSQAEIINEYLSILCTRAEDYYKIEYIGNNSNPNLYIIKNFDIDLIERIYENKLYDGYNYLNIIIKYFNDIKIESEDIYSIRDIDFEQNITLFYHIPIIIYILEHKIKSILRTERIYKNNLYEDNCYLNIIIKYFNNIKIESEDIYSLEEIDFEQNITLFYHIPIIIYILEHKIKSILRTDK